MRRSIPSVLIWDCRADGFGRCPLITIWVEIRPMSEKSRKKWQSFFHLFYFAWYGWQIRWKVRYSPYHVRARARLPTAILIFCCHKCHRRGKWYLEIVENVDKKLRFFWDVFVGVEVDYSLCLLKYVQVIRSSLRYSILWLGVTLVTAKKQKLL